MGGGDVGLLLTTVSLKGQVLSMLLVQLVNVGPSVLCHREEILNKILF